MNIQENGHYYTLPLTDYSVGGFAFDGSPSLLLRVAGNSHAPVFRLTITAPFKFTHYGHEQQYEAHLNVPAWQQLLQLWQRPIRKVLAYKSGELFIDFGQNTELLVQDSEYESWVIHHVYQNQVLHTWVVGGVGSTSSFSWLS